jgi:hypothetical protein
MDDPQKPSDDEDEYVPGEFSGLDEPDYDLERAAREREEWRRLFPEHDAFLREFERTGVAPDWKDFQARFRQKKPNPAA